MNVIQNLQKFRVRVRKCYRPHISTGYCGTGVQKLAQVLGRYENVVPVSGYCGMGVQNLQKIFEG